MIGGVPGFSKSFMVRLEGLLLTLLFLAEAEGIEELTPTPVISASVHR